MKHLVLISIKAIGVLILTLTLIAQLASAQSPLTYVFNQRNDLFSQKADAGLIAKGWNDGILYAGFCQNDNVTKQGITLSFFDTLGNMIWKKIFFIPEYTYLSVSRLLTLNNAGFYLAGSVYSDSPSYEALLNAAVRHAEQSLALSYPRDIWYVRFGVMLENAQRRLKKNPFRTFVHPAARLEDLIRSAGFELSTRQETWMWRVDVYTRTDR